MTTREQNGGGGECPRCPRPVLRVVEQPSTRIYVHDQGVKPAQMYGCAESKVNREARG